MGRAIVSMLRIWLVRISPVIGRPGGRRTLVGNGRTRDVIGQTMAKPVFSVNAAEETTRAGRRLACSLPLVGSKSVQIKSPWPGTLAGTVTPRRPHGQHPVPSRRPRR